MLKWIPISHTYTLTKQVHMMLYISFRIVQAFTKIFCPFFVWAQSCKKESACVIRIAHKISIYCLLMNISLIYAKMCLIWWCRTITECQSWNTIFAIVACETTTADWMVEQLFIFLSLIRLFFEDTLLSHRCTHSHIPIKRKRINNRKCGTQP